MPHAGAPRLGRAGALMAVLACALPAYAGLFSDDQARERITVLRTQLDETAQRLDASMQNQVEFANQVEAIRADIAKLRGQIDVLTYDLDATQKRQKDFYVDLDNRLRKIETPLQADAAAAKTAESEAVRDYESALAALKASNYKDAAAGFDAFIKKAPDSPQQASAHFFAGYCYGYLKQPAKAAEMYRLLAERWPDDEHVPDALLARAEQLDAAGNHKEAVKTLTLLADKYPATDAARQAKTKLKKK